MICHKVRAGDPRGREGLIIVNQMVINSMEDWLTLCQRIWNDGPGVESAVQWRLIRRIGFQFAKLESKLLVKFKEVTYFLTRSLFNEVTEKGGK